MSKPKAIILLSGGIDSTTALAMTNDRYELIPAHIQYGNRAPAETEAMIQICNWYHLPEPEIIDMTSIRPFLINKDGTVPYEAPYRNIIFNFVVAGLAIREGANIIIIGSHKEDESNGFADCTMQTNNAINHLMNVALPRQAHMNIQVVRPLATMFKKDIIKKADELDVPHELTVSCGITETLIHCGVCESCQYRKAAFFDAGVIDKTKYKE